MDNVIIIFVAIAIIYYQIQSEDYSVDAQLIEAVVEGLPQSVVQLLDAEPLGLRHTTAFLVLLSSVVIVTLSSLSACVKRRKNKQGVEELSHELVEQKRLIEIKDKELKQLTTEMRLKQEKFLLQKSNLLTKLNNKEDDNLANQIKEAEISRLKERLSQNSQALTEEVEKYDQLKNQQDSQNNKITELKRLLSEEKESYQTKIKSNEQEFQTKVAQMRERHEEKLKQHKDAQHDVRDENDNLQTQISELEEQLILVQEEESYDEMCQKLKSAETEFQKKICIYQMKAHKQWLISGKLERTLDAKKRESAKYEQMLTDLHKAVESGKLDEYFSRRKQRHVSFNEEPEVFTFDEEEPAQIIPDLPSPYDYWSDIVNGPVTSSRGLVPDSLV